ncbi:hypothetical protein QCA50_001872 [Cerrena zonata]|uniref:Uncharacterized protein n=1 Tax=Cerrena zonata TaxID=2478898 RepID=A0AAW0GUC8_9APHY
MIEEGNALTEAHVVASSAAAASDGMVNSNHVVAGGPITPIAGDPSMTNDDLSARSTSPPGFRPRGRKARGTVTTASSSTGQGNSGTNGSAQRNPNGTGGGNTGTSQGTPRNGDRSGSNNGGQGGSGKRDTSRKKK